MRESGFDPSFRFGPFDGATHHYAPVCLNSLLYRYERDLEHFAHLLGKPADAAKWDAAPRRATPPSIAIFGSPKRASSTTTISSTRKPSDLCVYLVALSPLGRRRHARASEADGRETQSFRARRAGLSMSNYQLRHAMGRAIRMGAHQLDRESPASMSAGFRDDAKRTGTRTSTPRSTQGFANDGTIREKYNVVSRNANVQVSDRIQNQSIGFGWTNAVYLKMKEIIGKPAARSAPNKSCNQKVALPSNWTRHLSHHYRPRLTYSGKIHLALHTETSSSRTWRRSLRLAAADRNRVLCLRPQSARRPPSPCSDHAAFNSNALSAMRRAPDAPAGTRAAPAAARPAHSGKLR